MSQILKKNQKKSCFKFFSILRNLWTVPFPKISKIHIFLLVLQKSSDSVQKYDQKCSKTQKYHFQMWGFTAKNFFFSATVQNRYLILVSLWRPLIRVSPTIIWKKSGVILFLFFDLVRRYSNWNFSGNF
jgi:hypothetical protein